MDVLFFVDSSFSELIAVLPISNRCKRYGQIEREVTPLCGDVRSVQITKTLRLAKKLITSPLELF